MDRTPLYCYVVFKNCILIFDLTCKKSRFAPVLIVNVLKNCNLVFCSSHTQICKLIDLIVEMLAIASPPPKRAMCFNDLFKCAEVLNVNVNRIKINRSVGKILYWLRFLIPFSVHDVIQSIPTKSSRRALIMEVIFDFQLKWERLIIWLIDF